MAEPEATAADAGRLLEEHGDALFRYAMGRLHDRDAAEDAVQETLLAALKNEAPFGGRSAERTWLTGILKHKIIDRFRRSAREVPASSLSDDDAVISKYFDDAGHWVNPPRGWDASPADLLRDCDFLSTLRGCLSKLPGRLAEAFTLREMDQLGVEEICEQLGITPTNLYVSLHRARFQLRRCIETNWLQDQNRGEIQ